METKLSTAVQGALDVRLEGKSVPTQQQFSLDTLTVKTPMNWYSVAKKLMAPSLIDS